MSRYAKQILFAPLGKDGQERLGRSRVTIIGLGALGSTLANHLVRAGVGFVRLCDRDFVELDNLQRQVLYDEDDVKAALPKAAAAATRRFGGRPLVSASAAGTPKPTRSGDR